MPESRQAVISLPIDGRAVLERFEAVERLSELFVITAYVLCDSDQVDFFPHLGEPAIIKITSDGQPVRAFHGLLFDAEYIEQTQAGFRYQLTLRPWPYILTRNLDYTIYQELGAVDIIRKTFERRSQSAVDFDKLNKQPEPREYCVQYRESDFAYASRLMEEEGIYYFFKHENDKHTLVLCDGRGSHPQASYGALRFNPDVGGYRSLEDQITRWNERVSSSAERDVVLRNFDFKKPAAPLEASYPGQNNLPAEKAEVFDYPAGFLAAPAGEALGQTILDTARRERRFYVGQGDAMSLACGQIFTLSKHPIDRLNQAYLIVGLHYRMIGESYRSGAASDEPDALVEIEAVPADTPWRAPIRTPRPIARGPETAIVTGPSGEEIFTDEFGRVKARFHWDRSASAEDKTSCWMRVASSWGGASFGELFLPRVGQEVIVDFLDGDPDRPLITGRVYNAQRMQVQRLPDEKTKSGLRTQTAYGKSTGAYDGAVDPPKEEPGFNEIAFEDKSGQELLTVRAQRDMREDVFRDERRNTHRDQTEEVGRHRQITIHTGNDTFTLEKGDEKHTVTTGKRDTQIQQDDLLKVAQGNLSTEVSMGNISVKASMGKIEIEAMQSIELKVGSSSVKLDPTGITIKGMMISAEAQTQLTAKGLITEVDGTGMMTVKGAIVMIN